MISFFTDFILKLLSFQRRFLSENNRKQFFRNPKNKIHPSFKIGLNNHFEISETAILEIEENVYFNDFNTIAIKKNAHFKVGKGTIFTKVTIGCMKNIEFGENCLIGGGTKFFDGDHVFKKDRNNLIEISPTEFKTSPIKIGNNVWTGANCIVLKGVTIGDNVILGAGCIIHKDIPPNSLVTNHQELNIKTL